MMEAIQTIEYRGFNIKIYPDETPIDPIEEFDMLGTMVCWHSRYTLGHKQPKSDPDEFLQELANEADPSIDDRIYYWDSGDGWSQLAKHDNAVELSNQKVKSLIQKAIDKHYITLPLYLYDHSGITIRTHPFSCPWDSGQVGFIYITKEAIKKEFSKKRMSKWLRKKAIEIMVNEVQLYDDYLTGNVYGYMIEPTDSNKSIECDDSCWGFYGDLDESHMIKEAKSNIDYAIKQYKEKVIQNHKRKLEMNAFMQCAWAY